MHTRLGWHTINNIKRIIVVQRTDTTNTYGGSSWRRTVSCNIHTRNAALKSLDRVILVLLGYLVNADYRDGTSQVGLALSGIPSNNYLVEQLGIFFENDAQTLGSLHHLSLIPHKRDRKFRTGLNLHRKVTINISNSTCISLSPHYGDSGTNNWFSTVVGNISTCLFDLGEWYRTDEQQAYAHQESFHFLHVNKGFVNSNSIYCLFKFLAAKIANLLLTTEKNSFITWQLCYMQQFL